MPKKGNPTASDSNFHEPPPPLRPKIFREHRLKLWDILGDADKPRNKIKGEDVYKSLQNYTH